MATPSLRALRRRFPTARIGFVGRSHLRALLQGAGLFDEYFAVSADREAKRRLCGQLRAFRADLGVVYPHSLRSALELLRVGVPVRVGYAREGRRLLLTHSLSPHRAFRRGSFSQRIRGAGIAWLDHLAPMLLRRIGRRHPRLLAERRQVEAIRPVPMIQQYLELVAVVGATDDGEGPRLGVLPETREAAREHLRELGWRPGDGLLGLNPGASFGPSKVYPISALAAAARRVAARWGLRPIVLCGPGEESLSGELAQELPGAIDTGRRLLRLDRCKEVIQMCRLLITTDTGPWHIATALSTPAVVLMGPTDPRYTSARIPQSVVLRAPTPCAPCHLSVCPFEHHACMQGIAPDRIVESARQLLAAGLPVAGER